MSRVLVTGMSGAGKSTLLDELSTPGHRTVDTDHDGWETAAGTWDEPRMAQLLATEHDVVISGTVENQGRFYDRFEHVDPAHRTARRPARTRRDEDDQPLRQHIATAEIAYADDRPRYVAPPVRTSCLDGADARPARRCDGRLSASRRQLADTVEALPLDEHAPTALTARGQPKSPATQLFRETERATPVGVALPE